MFFHLCNLFPRVQEVLKELNRTFKGLVRIRCVNL